jgi:plastocyanin
MASMPMKRLAPALLACLVLAVSGCGSDDDSGGGSSSSGSSSGSSGSSSSSSGGGGAASSAVKDTIKNFAFDPDPVTVKAGGTITWTNEDSAAHNVMFDDKSVKSIENLNQGETGDVTFDKAGTYKYVCSYHSGMDGTVEVQ